MSTTTSSVKAFIFCPPPLGKPDPTQTRSDEGLDTRNRVIQLGSKDGTCWYAVFNLLRERYKAPNTADLPARKFEQLASSLRKSLSAQDRSIPDLANQLNNDMIQQSFRGLTKEMIAKPQIREIIAIFEQPEATEVSVCTVFPNFLAQNKHKNLYDYLVYLKINGRQNIYNQFFAKLKVKPRDLFEIAKQRDPVAYQAFCEGKDWEDLGWEQTTGFLDNCARQLIARHYNMQVSSWHPCQPIKHLITELQKRGPLVVLGCFGPLHYSVAARNLGKQIEGRTVYGWTKSDPKNKGRVTGHAILLVGAEKTSTRELVYYIDPVDESDPSHPEKQRIYCMSYERLTSAETICDDHGFLRDDAPDTIGYAMYREKTSEIGEEKSPL